MVTEGALEEARCPRWPSGGGGTGRPIRSGSGSGRSPPEPAGAEKTQRSEDAKTHQDEGRGLRDGHRLCRLDGEIVGVVEDVRAGGDVPIAPPRGSPGDPPTTPGRSSGPSPRQPRPRSHCWRGEITVDRHLCPFVRGGRLPGGEPPGLLAPRSFERRSAQATTGPGARRSAGGPPEGTGRASVIRFPAISCALEIYRGLQTVLIVSVSSRTAHRLLTASSCNAS